MKELRSTVVGGLSIFTIQQQAFRNNLVLIRILFLYLKSKLRKGRTVIVGIFNNLRKTDREP